MSQCAPELSQGAQVCLKEPRKCLKVPPLFFQAHILLQHLTLANCRL